MAAHGGKDCSWQGDYADAEKAQLYNRAVHGYSTTATGRQAGQYLYGRVLRSEHQEEGAS